ncbi:hypothetical protein CDAR_196281 [Caerostris darwini]|uniref:Uncharacterized protein n=1 Tax=Caerostris darwini TaxID=1538125 RepID=A0AAV4PYN2_9ARAC|nr:hypothetical protein CDAR_196281 [Caerostris darwini]
MEITKPNLSTTVAPEKKSGEKQFPVKAVTTLSPGKIPVPPWENELYFYGFLTTYPEEDFGHKVVRNQSGNVERIEILLI